MKAGITIAERERDGILISQISPRHLVWGGLCSMSVVTTVALMVLLKLGTDLPAHLVIAILGALLLNCVFCATALLLHFVGVCAFAPQWAVTQIRRLRWRRLERSWCLQVGWWPFRFERTFEADCVRWLCLEAAPPVPRELNLVLVLATGERVNLLVGLRDELQAMETARRLAEAAGTDVRDALGRVVAVSSG